jgi:hypothetical protein
MLLVMSPLPAELKQIAIINSLRGCQLFVGLPLSDLENIAAVTVVKSLDKGQYLFHAGVILPTASTSCSGAP